MLSRNAKRISSTSSASARAGIRSLVLGADKGEDAVYSSKTFDDGDAPSPAGTPAGSRRSSMSAGFAARRDSVRASFSMTPLASESSANRSISTTAAANATVLPGISAIPIEAATNAPAQAPASYEHGSYEFSPKELAAVKKRVEEEFLLKSVTRRPLAQQARQENKVPFEFTDKARDEVLHPSGFVVPTPGEAPSSLMSETRVRQADVGANIREGVRSFAGLSSLSDVGMTTRRGKVPQEVLLADGRAVHSSGFVPPTPQRPEMEGVKDMFKPAVRAH